MEIPYQVNIVKIPLPSWNQRSILLVATTVTYGNYGSTILFAWTTDIKHISAVYVVSHTSPFPSTLSAGHQGSAAGSRASQWQCDHLTWGELNKNSCDLHKISGHIRSYLGELFVVGLIVVFIVGYVDIQWFKAAYIIYSVYIYIYKLFLLIIVIVWGII